MLNAIYWQSLLTAYTLPKESCQYNKIIQNSLIRNLLIIKLDILSSSELSIFPILYLNFHKIKVFAYFILQMLSRFNLLFLNQCIIEAQDFIWNKKILLHNKNISKTFMCNFEQSLFWKDSHKQQIGKSPYESYIKLFSIFLPHVKWKAQEKLFCLDPKNVQKLQGEIFVYLGCIYPRGSLYQDQTDLSGSSRFNLC